MGERTQLRLQLIVSVLVSASFTNVYITQPILPVVQREFSAGTVRVSFTVSAVILGTATSNLPFGFLADRLSIHPIILIGGVRVVSAGAVCALTTNLWVFIGARFVQGLLIPVLTTCLAVYLARTVPAARLNVVIGFLALLTRWDPRRIYVGAAGSFPSSRRCSTISLFA
jgi:YNFM family putative membrane transporter